MAEIFDEDPYHESKLCIERIRQLREEIANLCRKYNFSSDDWLKMGDFVTRLENVSFKYGSYQRQIYEEERE